MLLQPLTCHDALRDRSTAAEVADELAKGVHFRYAGHAGEPVAHHADSVAVSRKDISAVGMVPRGSAVDCHDVVSLWLVWTGWCGPGCRWAANGIGAPYDCCSAVVRPKAAMETNCGLPV